MMNYFTCISENAPKSSFTDYIFLPSQFYIWKKKFKFRMSKPNLDSKSITTNKL